MNADVQTGSGPVQSGPISFSSQHSGVTSAKRPLWSSASSPGKGPSQIVLPSHIAGRQSVTAPLEPGGDVYDSAQKINGTLSEKAWREANVGGVLQHTAHTPALSIWCEKVKEGLERNILTSQLDHSCSFFSVSRSQVGSRD